MPGREGRMKIAVLGPNKPFWGARIVLVPFLRALRNLYPGATVRLHSPVRPTAELLRWGLIDEHRTYRRAAWTRVLADLRRWWPDRVYNLRRKSAGMCLATAAAGGRRIGYAEGLLTRFLDERAVYDSHVYLATRYLALVDESVRGGSDARSVPLFRQWMTERIGAADDTARHLLLLPGAGNAEKKWPLERFLELARALGTDAGGRAVCVIGPGEPAERSALAGGGDVEVVDSPRVDALLRLVESASLVVANDNGPSHLAQLSGRRFLGLYRAGWSTVEDWFLDRPNADLLVTEPETGMDSLSVDAVAAAARSVLGREGLAERLVRFSRAEAERPRARE
jgi:ADP-heptose:LPS heptosyltransferase